MELAELSLYCLSDTRFYDTFDKYSPRMSDFYDVVQGQLGEGWSCVRNRLWFSCRPPQYEIQEHGWKLHCSSTLSDAEQLLAAITPVLTAEQIAFKFALDKGILGYLNGKRWPRGNAGKFVTIYPKSLVQCQHVAAMLDVATAEFQGPYILSDRRYKKSSVLHYRYGGFVRRETANTQGIRIPILNLSDGTDYQDQRQAYFVLPPGIADPFLDETHALSEDGGDSDSPTLNNGRYEIISSLAFTNAGGVYLATDASTGKTVVIKEARPHVGEFAPEINAQTLLCKEYRLLSKINDSTIAPRAIELFEDWEHLFLAQEYLKGTPFTNYCAAQGSPILSFVKEEEIHAFYYRFREVMLHLTRILKNLHDQHIIFGDLSPNNIIVNDSSGLPFLIDFEGALDRDEQRPINLCTPGFGSSARMADSVFTSPTIEDDLFALGAIMLSYILPINTLLVQKPLAPELFLNDIARRVGMPESIRSVILQLMDPVPSRRPGLLQVINVLMDDSQVPKTIPVPNTALALESICADFGRHILASAEPHRTDRLYPSDPSLFQTNPLSLSYGAAGVLYSLTRTGHSIPPEQLEWMTSKQLDSATYPANLAIGMAGIAWTLSELTRYDEASRTLQQALTHPMAYNDSSLYYGTAGLGLCCLQMYSRTSEATYLEKAIELAQQLMSIAQVDNGNYYWPSDREIYFGLARGSSGIALLFTYLAAVTGEREFKTFAESSLEFDLSHSIPWDDRGVQWQMQKDSSRTIYPYWDYGSAGVGASLVRYCSVFPDSPLKSFIPKVIIGARKRYTVFPSLSRGIAGIGMFLIDMNLFTGKDVYREQALEIAQTLSLFTVSDENGLGIPGERLLRLSCDVATGAAGVLLYMDRLLNNRTAPFLPDALISPMFGTLVLD